MGGGSPGNGVGGACGSTDVRPVLLPLVGEPASGRRDTESRRGVAAHQHHVGRMSGDRGRGNDCQGGTTTGHGACGVGHHTAVTTRVTALGAGDGVGRRGGPTDICPVLLPLIGEVAAGGRDTEVGRTTNAHGPIARLGGNGRWDHHRQHCAAAGHAVPGVAHHAGVGAPVGALGIGNGVGGRSGSTDVYIIPLPLVGGRRRRGHDTEAGRAAQAYGLVDRLGGDLGQGSELEVVQPHLIALGDDNVFRLADQPNHKGGAHLHAPVTRTRIERFAGKESPGVTVRGAIGVILIIKPLRRLIPAQAHRGMRGGGGLSHLVQLVVVDITDRLKLATATAAPVEGDLGRITRVILVVEIQAGGQHLVARQGGIIGHININLHRPVLVVGQRLTVPESGSPIIISPRSRRGVTQLTILLGQDTPCLNKVLGAPLGGIPGAAKVLRARGDRPRGELQVAAGKNTLHTPGTARDDAAVNSLIILTKTANRVTRRGRPTDSNLVLLPLVSGGVGGHHPQGVGGPPNDHQVELRLGGNDRHRPNHPIPIKVLGKGFLMVLELTGTKGGPKTLVSSIQPHPLDPMTPRSLPQGLIFATHPLHRKYAIASKTRRGDMGAPIGKGH